MLDLHVHSTFSDGVHDPEQLVEMAHACGLRGLGLTDHDTVAGIPSFLEAGRKWDVVTIPGVEISAEFEPGTMHILGYGIDWRHPTLERELQRYRSGREERNERILLNLAACGVRISMDQVLSYADEQGTVGRPHIALAMVQQGYVQSIPEAFGRYLASGKPGYADRARLSPEASIALIREAGGLPVLAHPSSLDLSDAALGQWVRRLTDQGLMGIEVYYPEHPRWFLRTLKRMTRELGLLATGGSDFHGHHSPANPRHKGLGAASAPDDLLEQLPGLP